MGKYLLHLCNREIFLFDLDHDMKRFFKAFKSKKPSLGSIREPRPATSTPTSTTEANLMASITACDSDAKASAQLEVTSQAGPSVSVQLCLSHL